jgi:predicted DNA-binding WGR domain protein
MHWVYMVRHDSSQNMHRFYQMTVSPGLFNDWSLVREWGRIGSPGKVRKNWYESEEDAITAGEKIREAKQKKGYRVVQ